MVQIKKQGTLVSEFDTDLAALRTRFAEQQCVRLPRPLAPDLLEIIQRRIHHTGFYERVHEGIGPNKELCLREGEVSGLLHFFLNNQALYRLIREITGCPRIGGFSGRVYRLSPGSGHHDDWHSDMSEHRMVGISINLSTQVYSGGILQIRDAGSEQILHEAVNTGYGDAIVVRLASYLQHRVTEVEGTHPKTAFAGWFGSQPDYLSALKENSRLA
jgi:hypothetical protein